MPAFASARRLASKLKTDPNALAGKGAVLRTGQVVSYSAGPPPRATVTVGGDPTEYPNCPCSVACAPGDVVQLAQQEPLVPTVIAVLG